MRYSSSVHASLILRLTSIRDGEASTTKTNQHEPGRFLRYCLAVQEAALCRFVKLLREAVKANLRWRHWITCQIIQEVPSEIAVCEFHCPRSQCTSKGWEACNYRLHKL
jgi:hypothetical protein